MRRTQFNLLQRLEAAGVHLLLCYMVAVAVLGLVWFGWYPGPLFQSMGVGHVVWLLLAVDVCIGPILTFTVFNLNKPYLKFDLAVIASLQMVGLAYGLNALYQGRPAWLVFVQDRFEVARLADVDDKYLKGLQIHPKFLKPVWAAVPLMSDDQKSEYFTQVMKGEADVAQRPSLFRSMSENWEAMLSKAAPLEDLSKINDAEAVQSVLSEHSSAKSWLPLQATEGSLVVLLGESADQLNIVKLNGWATAPK